MRPKAGTSTVIARIAAALVVLTSLSLCVNFGITARYSGGDNADNSAHAAAFSVSAALGEPGISAGILFEDIAPGESPERTVIVTSASEVKVRCTVSLTTTGNLPLTFSFAVGGGITVESNTGDEIVFILEPNHGDVVLHLTASWSEHDNDIAYLGEIDVVHLVVTAEQID